MATDQASPAISPSILASSDADLVKACRENEEGAWEQLVNRFQRLVYAVPRRAGLDENQAQDVFQDVFLTLFQKIDALENPSKVRAWLVTTAKFRTWQAVRSRHGHYSPATDEEMENELASITDEGPLADDMLIELEQQHQIRTALSSMGEPCKTILEMLYMRDPAASYADVAEAVGAAATGIGPMRSRCLKKLEKLLGQ
jgi:RNA polymerase sigma factor (sigma-70 family)